MNKGEMMRLLLVYPGSLYSTIDVATGYTKAFKEMDDVKLFTFRFEKSLTYHDYACKFIFGKSYNQDMVITAASDDLLVKILKCRPDYVLFVSGIAFPTTTWDYVGNLQQDLKTQFKTAVLLTESPYVSEWEEGILQRVDMAFTTDYGIIPKYKEVNENLFYIKHAYNQDVHYTDDRERDIDVFMVGTGFPERQRLLENVNWDGIGLDLYGNWMYMGESGLKQYLKGGNLNNEETADKYRQSKIALNIFRTVQWPDANPKFIEPSMAKSLSPRVYEAMACGACLFTDWREELDEFPKDSYVLWGDAKDLAEKIRYYLSHDEERQAIAKRGQDVIQGETFNRRAIEVLEKLNGTHRMC